MTRMKKKLATQILVAGALLSTVLGGTALADTWFPYYSVTGILVHHDSLEVTLAGSSNCSRTFRLRTSEQNYDVKASGLLSAYYAGHDVSVAYDGDLASCSTPLRRFKVRP